MSMSVLGRILGIAVAAGVSGPARAVPPALVPIDPFCNLTTLSACVEIPADPGIVLPAAKSNHWRTLEVGYFDGLVCSFEAASQKGRP
jgi:hypothetical protein